jgi:hypothetical protein
MDKELNKNVKVSPDSFGSSSRNMSIMLSYTKTNKLITALYIVTDIIEKEEPIRHKLRTLGADIVSDIQSLDRGRIGHLVHNNLSTKISEIISFLDIASAINLISDMNGNILKKEFIELTQSVNETIHNQQNLSEFFVQGLNAETVSELPSSIGHDKGHINRTRIGVQKGSTLMKALSDKTNFMSHKNYSRNRNDLFTNVSGPQDFNILKNKRREYILNIIKNNSGNATIKDIRIKINIGQKDSIISSEKTLQRELMSMIKDGVLYKTGEKRWSRYLIRD